MCNGFQCLCVTPNNAVLAFNQICCFLLCHWMPEVLGVAVTSSVSFHVSHQEANRSSPHSDQALGLGCQCADSEMTISGPHCSRWCRFSLTRDCLFDLAHLIITSLSTCLHWAPQFFIVVSFILTRINSWFRAIESRLVQDGVRTVYFIFLSRFLLII